MLNPLVLGFAAGAVSSMPDILLGSKGEPLEFGLPSRCCKRFGLELLGDGDIVLSFALAIVGTTSCR